MQWLENIYNSTSTFLTNVLNSGISIVKVLIRSNLNIKNHPIKGIKKCVILGNGPSLSDSLIEYASILQNYQLIAVNGFALAKEYLVLKPNYYVLHDPAFWTAEDKLPEKIFNAIKSKTDWPLTIYIPNQAKNSLLINSLISEKITIIYYNYVVYKGFTSLGHFLFNKNLAMPQSQNVLVACLFLTINMGFKDIYTLGADHTWHENLVVNENNVLCIKNVHFYSEETKVDFKPFRKGLDVEETFKVYEIFEIWTKVFKGYEVISGYAKAKGSKIYNASKVSFIDTFERKKLS